MNGPRNSDRWSARGYVLFGLFCVLLLGGGLGGWSATAELQGAVISKGQLRVETRRQVVQHPDGGVVGEILVREGDVVAPGDILVRLDGVLLQSEIAVLESELYEVMARRARLKAEEAGRDDLAFDPELLEAAKTNAEIQSLMDGQRELFEARLGTMRREIEVMHERQAQLRHQIEGTVSGIAALKSQRALIREELVIQHDLLSKGLTQASRVLALEREAAQIDGEEARLTAQAAQLRGRVSEIETELLRLDATRREAAIAELRDLGFRELEFKERRLALATRLSRLDVRAPLGGVVLDLAVHTIGAVVRPAEMIAQIVPQDAAIVVDVEIDPTRIDEVQVGKEAALLFSAFNARRTPMLSGIVTKVSADAFTDKELGRSFYRGEVLPEEGEIAKLEGGRLVSGMPVEVFIQTGARTPLEYLMKPITDYLARAVREE